MTEQKEKTEIVQSGSKALAQYEITPKKVAAMAKEYLTLKVPEGDTKAYKEARAALTMCVSTRTGTHEHRKKLGEDARTWIKDVNAAATELLEPLIKVEEHLREELGREDGRKAKIKLEKEAKELKRVSEIREKIATINSFSASLNWQLTVDELNVILGNLEVLVITPDEYMEFTAEATLAKSEVMAAVLKAVGAREVFDKEEAERKAEDERLAKEREKLDAQKKAQEEEQAKLDAEKKRVEEEEFKRKAKIQAEKDAQEKIKREKREKEEKEKAEAEEKARLEALKPDKEKMIEWLNSLSMASLPPFVEDGTLLSIGQDISAEFGGIIKNGRKNIEEL